jgi:nucleoside-diphosphate-sugar epimerase
MENDLILVSGASGYLATHIVKLLQEQGYRVRGTVRSLTDAKKVDPLRKLVKNPNFPLELVEANLLEESSWVDAVKDCKYVIHTASPFPNSIPRDETELTLPAVNGILERFD